MVLPLEFSELLAMRGRFLWRRWFGTLALPLGTKGCPNEWFCHLLGIGEPFPSRYYLLDHCCACYKDGNCSLNIPIKMRISDFITS